MKTIEKTIQHPERYEAPGVKVKVLRKRVLIVASNQASGSTDGDWEDDE